MSLGEVEERLKLSVKQLNAIEQGDYSLLPGATFTRGFVRNYARLLGLDAEQVQKTLDVCIPLDAPSAKLVELPPQPAKPAFALPLTLLILLAIAGFWFFSSSSASETAPATTGDASASLSVEVSPAEPASAAVSLTESAPLAANVVASAVVPVVPAAPIIAPVTVAPAKVASSDLAVVASGPAAIKVATAGVIRLQSSGSAWVSVVDADGKKLVFETLAANGLKEVQGKAPFKLTIGNAAQVTLHYQGQPVDLAANIRGTTAKLELN